MSDSPDSESFQDPLSDLLRRLHFSATVFFRAEYCGRWGVDTSGNTEMPFHLVAEGRCWLHGDDHDPIELNTGDLVLFPNDSAHVLAYAPELPDARLINQPPQPPSAGDATRLICGFFRLDRRAAGPLLASLPDTMTGHLGTSTDTPGGRVVQLWIDEAQSTDLGSDLIVDRLAELVFVQLLRSEVAAGRLSGLVAALSDPRIGAVLAAIHRDPGEPHRVETLAALANMSPSALTDRFKTLVGSSPGDYVRHWRMHRAAERLRDGNDSIDVIGFELGYATSAAFRKAFSAFFGTPPGAYRKAALEEEAP